MIPLAVYSLCLADLALKALAKRVLFWLATAVLVGLLAVWFGLLAAWFGLLAGWWRALPCS